MASLYVEEYRSLGTSESNAQPVQAPLCPPDAAYVVAIAGSQTQSPTFGPNTRFVFLSADAVCSVLVGGTNPQATATNFRLPANSIIPFAVKGQNQKLSVIANV